MCLPYAMLIHIVRGLCCTDQWKRSLSILSETADAGRAAKNTVVEKAFREGELDLGFQLLDETVTDGNEMDQEVCAAYWKFCRQNGGQRFVENVERMLRYLERRDAILTKTCMQQLLDMINELGSSGFFTQVDQWYSIWMQYLPIETIILFSSQWKVLQMQEYAWDRGPSCRRIRATEESHNGDCTDWKEHVPQYDARRSEKVREIHRNNCTIRHRFGWVECRLPGTSKLNNMGESRDSEASYPVHTYSNMGLNMISIWFKLASVVSHFAERKLRVLVIGRKHMNGWPSKTMNYIRENSIFFAVQN